MNQISNTKDISRTSKKKQEDSKVDLTYSKKHKEESNTRPSSSNNSTVKGRISHSSNGNRSRLKTPISNRGDSRGESKSDENVGTKAKAERDKLRKVQRKPDGSSESNGRTASRSSARKGKGKEKSIVKDKSNENPRAVKIKSEVTSKEKAAIDNTPKEIYVRTGSRESHSSKEYQNEPQPLNSFALLMRRSKGSNLQVSFSEDFSGNYLNECNETLEDLKEFWGVKLNNFPLKTQVPFSRSPLASKKNVVIVMEGWNKALAFRSMFSEAITGRWRMSAAISYLTSKHDSSLVHSKTSFRNLGPSFSFDSIQGSTVKKALSLVEKNNDPIACCLGLRLRNLESLVVGMIDIAVRELCPHTQQILREAYTPVEGSADESAEISESFLHEDECRSLDDFCLMFARYGLKPEHWIDFCEAFVWTMKTHNPYANQEQETDDFDKPNDKSAFGTFIAGMVATPLIEASLHYSNYLHQQVFFQLQKIYSNFQSTFAEQALNHDFGNLFMQLPGLEDHFSIDGVQKLYNQLIAMLEDLVANLHDIRNCDSNIRRQLDRLGESWLDKGVPFDFMALIGCEYLDAVKPFLDTQVGPSLANELERALSYLYKEASHFIMQPLLIDKNLRYRASSFYKDIAAELNWSNQVLEKRLVEVNLDIDETGTYTHTSEEIEIGARLAWRNSGKCIGRIAWNTLKIRDRRHLFSADTIFHEIDEHLKVASGGTNIESVMTVFRPQQPNEIFGLRFWSSQIFRYAGYKNTETNEVLGDPANADFTEFLIKANLWKSPTDRSAFDLLPLILKIPTIDKPFLYDLVENLHHEVNLEHPDFPAVKDMGLKWSAIPAITNMKLNLGGICYPCIPFNGWFASIEIARNLLERYDMIYPFAKAVDIDSSDRMLAQKVSAEMENAILYSFEKAKYTIVDSMTAGKSFLTHCKRERIAGRECPGQWSWIGGLVGPTNPTWHLEMRDFLKEPQYEWGCSPWKVISFGGNYIDQMADTSEHIMASLVQGNRPKQKRKLPRVLIAYGSETGTAEAAANNLARKLKVCMPRVMSLNDVAKMNEKFSKDYTYFIGICSTFGDGEPPCNASDFFDIELQPIDNLSCAVLALGSSMYPKFCQAGKDLYEKLISAGGNTFMKLTCIDNANDSQRQIIEWTERLNKLVLPDSLMEDLLNMTTDDSKKGATKYEIKWRQEEDSLPSTMKQYQYPDRISSLCTKNSELLNSSDRSTKYVEFELSDGVTYKTGDHLSIYPINDLALVTRFFNCFAHELEKAASLNGYYSLSSHTKESKNDNASLSTSIMWQVQQPFYLESNEDGEHFLVDIEHLTNFTLLEALQAQLELTLNQEVYIVDLFSMMLGRLDNSSISSELSKTFKLLAQSVIDRDIQRQENISVLYPTIVHLLEEFSPIFCEPSAGDQEPILTLADLMVVMPRMNPRYYCISSSALSFPSTVTITVEVITTKSKDGEDLKGVCSGYLARLQPGERAKIAIKKSSFKPPDRKDAPIIMISADTGIASLIGFLRERSKEFYTGSNRDLGECKLFLGFRTRNDILYHDELSSWQSIYVLNLNFALSDDDSMPKEYVHDQLKEQSEKLNELLLHDDVHVYISGKSQMATDCTKACIESLMTSGGISRVAAVRHIKQMIVENRWMFDIYDKGDFTKVLQEASQL